jgi:hypothetical protein
MAPLIVVLVSRAEFLDDVIASKLRRRFVIDNFVLKRLATVI